MFRYIALLAVLSALSISSFAQAPGGLKGIVIDPSGALVPGAHVRVTSPDGAVREAISRGDGSWTLMGLAPGKYSIRASAAGLFQPEATTVEIAGAVAILNLTLRIVVENTQVTVQDQVGLNQISTDPSQSAAAIVINGDALDALSDDPDDLVADLQALAGPAAGLNGPQFFIDGFTAGDAVLPSKASIREIRINQNPFAPDVDAIGYGRIHEIFTKPGHRQVPRPAVLRLRKRHLQLP